MSRYIDADTRDNTSTSRVIPPAYKPTADVVEVVRCKYCKHFHDGIYNGEYWMECDEYRIALSSDEWFCADGKRREDEIQTEKRVS